MLLEKIVSERHETVNLACAELDELGITPEELTTVAGLYQPGETLWRVPLRHFSPCDLNYAIVFPDDAVFPRPEEVTCDEKDPCPPLESGSIIEITNQILRESVGVVGTPFTLNYASDRVPGRKGATTINVPLTGEDIPASLQRVDMIVEVAGQRFVESFPPAPNLVHQVPWDGKDAYGRQLQGHQPVTVQIGFVYDGVYVVDFSRALSRTFGFPRATRAEVGTRRPLTHWRTRRSTAGAGGWDARGLGMGGWSLSAHHVYDPAAQEIYFGDGSRQSGNHVGPSIKTVAGTGNYDFSGDGGPATEAGLAEPERIAIGPEGRLYFADSGNGRVRRLGHDGRVTTLLVGEPYDDGGIAQSFSLAPAFSPEAAFSSSNCENNPVNYVDPEGLRLRVNPNLSPCDQEKLNGYLGFLRSLESGRTLLEKLELNPNDITITIGDVKRELGYSNPGTLLSF